MTDFPRPPILDEAALCGEQRMVFETIASGPRGVVEGPLRVWLQSAGLADKAQALGAFCRYQTLLPPRLSELAILITGAFWKSGFEWAVHTPIALENGIAEEIADAIRNDEAPVFVREDERILYAFCHALHHSHTVPEAVYQDACRIFGVKAVVELVGLLGYYTLISMTINAFKVPLPEGAEEPFAAV